jgi:hypothetical protein
MFFWLVVIIGGIWWVAFAVYMYRTEPKGPLGYP